MMMHNIYIQPHTTYDKRMCVMWGDAVEDFYIHHWEGDRYTEEFLDGQEDEFAELMRTSFYY